MGARLWRAGRWEGGTYRLYCIYKCSLLLLAFPGLPTLALKEITNMYRSICMLFFHLFTLLALVYFALTCHLYVRYHDDSNVWFKKTIKLVVPCSAVKGLLWTRMAAVLVSWKDSSPCWPPRVLCPKFKAGSVFPSLPPPPRLPQIKMSVPSSPLSAPLTAPSAPTTMAAISAVPRGDATRALSPTMMGQPVWVSAPGRVGVQT